MRIFSSYLKKLVNSQRMGYHFCMETIKTKSKVEELNDSFVTKMISLINEDGLNPKLKAELENILTMFQGNIIIGKRHDNTDLLNNIKVFLLEVRESYPEIQEPKFDTFRTELEDVINLVNSYQHN